MSLNNIKINNNQVTTVDDEPIFSSQNLVKSGGVFDRLRSTGENLLLYENTINNKYLNPTTGQIGTASTGYQVIKFHLSEDTIVFAYFAGTQSSAGCVKYEDSSYSTVSDILIKQSTDGFFCDKLKAGYYAVGSQVNTPTQVYKCNILSKLNPLGNNITLLGIYTNRRIYNSKFDYASINEYVIKKIYIEYEGNYEVTADIIFGTNLLSEFSDETYTTYVRTVIAGQNTNNIKEVVHLTPGYYMLSIFNKEPYRTSIKKYIYNGDSRTDVVTYLNANKRSAILFDGTITTNSTNEYYTAKLELSEGVYQIDLTGTKTGLAIARYTDNTYSTLKRRYVFSGCSYNEENILKLPAGYYAVCLFLDKNERFYKLNIVDESLISNTIFHKYEALRHGRLNKNGTFTIYTPIDDNPHYYVTKYINAGYYEIYLNATNNSTCLVKYSDSDYSVVEKIFEYTSLNQINQTIYLDEGYYGIGWKGISPIFKSIESLPKKRSTTFDLSSRNIIKKLPFNSITYQGGCVFSSSDVEDSKCLFPYIGPAVSSYKIAKFHIDSGFYTVYCPNSESGMALVKFTDNNYEVVDYSIFNSSRELACIVYLEDGYYCFGWEQQGDYVEGTAFVSPNLPTTKWTISDNIWSNSSSVSIDERIISKYPTFANEQNISAVVIPNSFVNGIFECSIGKDFNLGMSQGTFITLGKDSNGSYIALSTIETENSAVSIIKKFKKYIQDLTLQTGKKYTLNLEQRDGTYRYHNISLVTEKGIEYRFDKLESSYSESVGSCWGYVTAIPSIGTCTIQNVYLGYPIDFNNIKLIIVGHSLVEGMNSTVANLDKRFASLLAEKIGAENCIIKGQGGASVPTLSLSLYNDLKLLNNSRYLLICIGGNDRDADYIGNGLKYFDNLARKYGVTPIWLTVGPFRDGSKTFPTLNSVILTFENVVDIRPIFYNDDGTINTSMFSDIVHPTIEGYRRIFNMIAAQCSYLFNQ